MITSIDDIPSNIMDNANEDDTTITLIHNENNLIDFFLTSLEADTIQKINFLVIA